MPDWAWEAIGVVVGIGPVLTIMLWSYVWLKVQQSAKVIPTLRRGLGLAASMPPRGRVCVVVPAYNEAACIAALIGSLRAETYGELSVVLALDRCTDATETIAREAIGDDERFEIVVIETCPPDWAGKVHAVHAGVTRSRAAREANYLLFADADTTFSPGCVVAALALMRERRLDLLSLLSTLRYESWFERVAQMATSFELMRMYPLVLANQAVNRRPFANGQFMLFRREAYDAVGGHTAVRKALLEDLALARRIDAAGRSAGVFVAAGLFHCRMYASWAEFRRGWKRIYTEGAQRNVRWLELGAMRIRVLGTILPVWTLAAWLLIGPIMAGDAAVGSRLLALTMLATFTWAGALLRIAMMAHAPFWTVPLHIVGAWMAGGLFAEAADDLRAKRPTVWGGREYDLDKDKP